MGGQGAGFIVRENALSAVCDPVEQLSVARTVKLNVPDVVGVPEMSPVEPSANPGGRVPDRRLKETGGSPPDDCNWMLCVCPTVPGGSGDGVVMLRDGQAAGFTVRRNVAGSGGPIDAPGGRVHCPGSGLLCAVMV
jgi:hypothetical protein